MSKHLFVAILILVMLPAYAMSDASQWVEAIPNASLVSVERTLDGGYIAAGSQSSKALLIRVHSSGNIQWAKTYKLSGNDSASMVYQASDGGFVFMGNTNTRNGDVFAMKTDAAGKILWQKVYGTSSHEEGRVIIRTPDGGFFLLGNKDHPDGWTMWCMKLNSKREISWVRFYGPGPTVTAAVGTSDGGLIMTGSPGTAVGPFGGGTIVVKIDSSGKIVWQKVLKGIGVPGSITKTADGGYVLGANQGPHWGITRGYAVKLDHNGNVSWSKLFGDCTVYLGGRCAVVTAVRQETDGHVLVIGSVEAGLERLQIWSARFTLDGGFSSQQAFGGIDTPVEYRVSAIHDTLDDGTVFVGSRDTVSNTDGLFGRTSSAGNTCTAFQESTKVPVRYYVPELEPVHVGSKKGAFEVRTPNFVQNPVAANVTNLCK